MIGLFRETSEALRTRTRITSHEMMIHDRSLKSPGLLRRNVSVDYFLWWIDRGLDTNCVTSVWSLTESCADKEWGIDQTYHVMIVMTPDTFRSSTIQWSIGCMRLFKHHTCKNKVGSTSLRRWGWWLKVLISPWQTGLGFSGQKFCNYKNMRSGYSHSFPWTFYLSTKNVWWFHSYTHVLNSHGFSKHSIIFILCLLFRQLWTVDWNKGPYSLY